MKPCSGGGAVETRAQQSDASAAVSSLNRAASERGPIAPEEGELSQAILSAVLDALPVGVIIADAKGKIVRDNEASRTRWGAPPITTNWEGYSEWIGYWPETGARLTAGEWAMARTLRTGETVRDELVRSEHSETGERRFFLNYSAPIRDRDGRIMAAVVAEVDITECRKVEEQLRESEERLCRLNADLEREVEARTAQAREALAKFFEAQKIESIGQFTSTVVHDFNNVLAVIMANLRVLRRQLKGQAHEHTIDGAIATAERAANLAGRLLLYARRQDSTPRPVSLPTLLEGMRELLEYSLGPEIDCVFNAPTELSDVIADPNLLELALMNLATNARDAMPRGGAFCIEVVEERLEQDQQEPALRAGAYVRISASDTGCGMNEATLAQAAEPLFTTKAGQNGTGLGLSMIRDFVVNSGGALRIRSAEGKGACVDLWLPSAFADARDAAKRN